MSVLSTVGLSMGWIIDSEIKDGQWVVLIFTATFAIVGTVEQITRAIRYNWGK